MSPRSTYGRQWAACRPMISRSASVIVRAKFGRGAIKRSTKVGTFGTDSYVTQAGATDPAPLIHGRWRGGRSSGGCGGRGGGGLRGGAAPDSAASTRGNARASASISGRGRSPISDPTRPANCASALASAARPSALNRELLAAAVSFGRPAVQQPRFGQRVEELRGGRTRHPRAPREFVDRDLLGGDGPEREVLRRRQRRIVHGQQAIDPPRGQRRDRDQCGRRLSLRVSAWGRHGLRGSDR